MPVKHLEVAGIGSISIYKHRNARSIKITILAKSGVRVTIPSWLPYKAGLQYAKSKASWIKEHQKVQINLLPSKRVGKHHRLSFEPNSAVLTVRVDDNEIKVTYPSHLTVQSASVQAKAVQGCERALRQEAEALLPQRLSQLAAKHQYRYKGLGIKKLKSRWGSCNQQHFISLNLFLMLLPWSLIDYVLLHELNHTKHLNHSREFWAEMDENLPNTKELRRQLRTHRPSL